MQQHSKKIVVLSGAGISVESGIATFRGTDGLWEGHDIMEVASPAGWAKNPALVLDFYNKRRRAAFEALPNQAHQSLADLEQFFEVVIVTQNVDNLHEKAGSTRVLHLHGELFRSRSTQDPSLVYQIKGTELCIGDTCEKGSQLRPDIVWFHEEVPMMELAIEEAMSADIFIVVGTSLVVYPAAGLMGYVAREVPKYIVDIEIPAIQAHLFQNIHFIKNTASQGLALLAEELKAKFL